MVFSKAKEKYRTLLISAFTARGGLSRVSDTSRAVPGPRRIWGPSFLAPAPRTKAPCPLLMYLLTATLLHGASCILSR